jgi:hypothetical protein
MMLFAEDQDVVAQGLEADGRLPHVLWHLDPRPQVIPAFVQQVNRIAPSPDLLPLQDTVGAIAYSPDVTARFTFPNSSHSPLIFSRHNGPSEDKIAKYHQKYHQHFETRKSLSGREAVVFVSYSFYGANLGAGRGGRTPTRLPSADFESAASASSAIPALQIHSRNKRHFQSDINRLLLIYVEPASPTRPSGMASSSFQYRIAPSLSAS